MAKVITTELQHSGASSANLTLDSSKNVTIGGNLTVTGINNAKYDDTKLRRDLNILALHTAIDNNKAAHNLSDSFIDQFESSAGVGSTTQAMYDSTTESYSSTSVGWGSGN